MFEPNPLLAFGFSNLAMLGWLAAAAAPLLIHLWSRHRFREAPWAAMQFLLAALRKNSRRLQLQQWILLALRTLLILLVVLAVAEPYGEQLMAGAGSAPVHKVLVLDGSMSMAYRDDNSTRFERAKALAAELVRSSRAGDVFTVVLMTNEAKALVNHETADHATVATQIESLRQTHSTADFPAALDLVDATLTEATKDTRAPTRHEVYFFTDLQRLTWQSGGIEASPGKENGAPTKPSSTESNTDARLRALAERAGVFVIDVGQSGATNLAVTHVKLSEPLVTVGRDAGIEVTIQPFGTEPRPDCEVELLVDDVPVGQQTLKIPAAGEASVRFSHRFSSSGNHTVAVRVAGDPLPPDNSRWLIAPVRDQIRVLCVAGRDGAARYVASALNPSPESPRSAIRPIVVSEGQLAELELADFECVFLCNVAQLTSDEAERLTRYVAAGGGLVIFLGDRVIPSSYNAYAPGANTPVPISDFGFRIADSQAHVSESNSAIRGSTELAEVNPQAAIERPSLLPAQIGEPVTQSQFGIDPLDYRHPIVAPFRGRERAGLLTTPISRYFRLDLSQTSPQAAVAAATPGGDPLIVTAQVGRGRTALVATDASLTSVDATGEPWTLWPAWPSFLPIVRELLAFVGGGPEQSSDPLVGTVLHGSLPNPGTSAAGGQQLQVSRPDGRTAFAAIQTTSDGLEWSFRDTDLSGIYSLQSLPDAQVKQFAVNVDTSESDLSRIDVKDLSSNITVRTTSPDESDAGGTAAVFTLFAWSQRLLWAALAIMFVESLVAWRFGRGGA